VIWKSLGAALEKKKEGQILDKGAKSKKRLVKSVITIGREGKKSKEGGARTERGESN